MDKNTKIEEYYELRRSTNDLLLIEELTLVQELYKSNDGANLIIAIGILKLKINANNN